MWQDYIHVAIAETHPDAFMTGAYSWLLGPDGEPFMERWDTNRLGPLKMVQLRQRCEELMLPQNADLADISPRQFYNGLWRHGIITDVEFLDALAGKLPAAIVSIMDMPEFDLAIEPTGLAIVEVKALFIGAKTFEYKHVLTRIIAQIFGWNAQQTYDFWIECAAL